MLNRILIAYFRRFKPVYTRFNKDDDLYVSAYLFISSVIGTWFLSLAFVIVCIYGDLPKSGLILVSAYLAPFAVFGGLKKRFAKLDSEVRDNMLGFGESIAVITVLSIISVAITIYCTTLC
jgi:hypothetical protein